MHQSLPLEIIYLIIDFIDEPYVLCQLALTSKSLHQFITSNHLYFRSIRCQWGQTGIWRLFQTDVNIASRIRSLEFLEDGYGVDTPTPLLPPSCRALMTDSPATREDSVAIIKKALVNMTDLTKLFWRSWKNSDTVLMEELDACLDFTLCCRGVQGMCIHIREHAILTINPSLLRDQNSKASIVTDHLTRIDIYLDCFRIQYENKRLVDLIVNRCPKLEDLTIRDSFSISAPTFLADGHWPNLRRLALKDVICFSEDDGSDVQSTVLNAFLRRHPNIEDLLLTVEYYPLLYIQPGLLPKLKSLSGSLGQNVCSVATDVLVRIEHLSDINESFIPYYRPLISNFKHATSLTSLVILDFDEAWQRLLSNHPTITRFAFYRIGHFVSNTPVPNNKQHQRAQSIFKTLSTLPRLTHLYHAYSGITGGVPELLSMASFPKLRYVVAPETDEHWYVIERDAEGMVTGWHRAESFTAFPKNSNDYWEYNLKVILGYD